jgi:hypothetical protein
MPLLGNMTTLRTVIFGFVCLFSAGVDAAALRGPFVSGSRFEFGLDCESNAVYLIERSTNLIDWSVVARNDDLTTNRALSCSNYIPHAFFRALRTNEPLFQYALAARRGIDLSGCNLRTDSFDSADPLYNDGFGHYTNSSGKWKDNGAVACNDFITNTISASGAKIYGRVATGPNRPPDVGSQGAVGDIAWVEDPANRGKIKAGWWTTNANLKFPSVIIPYELLAAGPPPGGSRTIDGVVYYIYLDGGIGGRDYFLPSGMSLTGKIYVEGHVRLLVTGNSAINLTGSDIIKIKSGTNNSLQIFADVANVAIGGQGVANDNTANQFYYFGTDRNTSLSFGGNGTFTGIIYAPNASLQLNGSGGTPIDFSGCAVARSIKVNGNLNCHYDENLLRAGAFR